MSISFQYISNIFNSVLCTQFVSSVPRPYPKLSYIPKLTPTTYLYTGANNLDNKMRFSSCIRFAKFLRFLRWERNGQNFSFNVERDKWVTGEIFGVVFYVLSSEISGGTGEFALISILFFPFTLSLESHEPLESGKGLSIN